MDRIRARAGYSNKSNWWLEDVVQSTYGTVLAAISKGKCMEGKPLWCLLKALSPMGTKLFQKVGNFKPFMANNKKLAKYWSLERETGPIRKPDPQNANDSSSDEDAASVEPPRWKDTPSPLSRGNSPDVAAPTKVLNVRRATFRSSPNHSETSGNSTDATPPHAQSIPPADSSSPSSSAVLHSPSSQNSTVALATSSQESSSYEPSQSITPSDNSSSSSNDVLPSKSPQQPIVASATGTQESSSGESTQSIPPAENSSSFSSAVLHSKTPQKPIVASATLSQGTVTSVSSQSITSPETISISSSDELFSQAPQFLGNGSNSLSRGSSINASPLSGFNNPSIENDEQFVATENRDCYFTPLDTEDYWNGNKTFAELLMPKPIKRRQRLSSTDSFDAYVLADKKRKPQPLDDGRAVVVAKRCKQSISKAPETIDRKLQSLKIQPTFDIPDDEVILGTPQPSKRHPNITSIRAQKPSKPSIPKTHQSIQTTQTLENSVHVTELGTISVRVTFKPHPQVPFDTQVYVADIKLTKK